MLPKMIGISGPKESGKSSTAEILCSEYGYVRHRFAGPIKKALKVAFGLTDAHVDGHLKEVPTPLLGGRTPRHAMKTMGTQWGRKMIHEDIWVIAWLNTMPDSDLIVVDDIRFPNEIAMLQKDFGAKIIRTARPGCEFDASHESEAHSELYFDHKIENSAGLDELILKVQSAIETHHMWRGEG